MAEDRSGCNYVYLVGDVDCRLKAQLGQCLSCPFVRPTVAQVNCPGLNFLRIAILGHGNVVLNGHPHYFIKITGN